MHKQTQKESKEERAAVATLSGSHSFRSEGNFFLRAARCHDDRRHYQLQSRDRCPSKKKNHCNWLPLHFSCRWRLISMQMRADFFRFKTISFEVIGRMNVGILILFRNRAPVPKQQFRNKQHGSNLRQLIKT